MEYGIGYLMGVVQGLCLALIFTHEKKKKKGKKKK